MKTIKIKIWIIVLIIVVCSAAFFFAGFFVSKIFNSDTSNGDTYHSEYAGIWQATESSGSKRMLYLQTDGSCLSPDYSGDATCVWKQDGDYIIAKGKDILVGYNTYADCDRYKDADDTKYEYRDISADGSNTSCVLLSEYERKYTILDDGSLYYNSQLTYRRVKTY